MLEYTSKVYCGVKYVSYVYGIVCIRSVSYMYVELYGFSRVSAYFFLYVCVSACVRVREYVSA